MSNRFRLRGLKVTRVDTVDAGANQDSHILFTKGHDKATCKDPKCACKKKGTAYPEEMAAAVSKHGKTDLVKHYGPGDHADGTPQSVHSPTGQAARPKNRGVDSAGRRRPIKAKPKDDSRAKKLADMDRMIAYLDDPKRKQYPGPVDTNDYGPGWGHLPDDWQDLEKADDTMDKKRKPKADVVEIGEALTVAAKRRAAGRTAGGGRSFAKGLPASPASAPRVAAAPAGPRRVASPAPTRATGGGGLPSSPATAAPGIGQANEPLDGEVPEHPNQNSRLVHISPADFKAIEGKNGTTEWYIPPEGLPEGVEEAIITMVPSGDAPAFQWMIDPLIGPPIDGTAKSAAEAFMAMRSALTQSRTANTDVRGPFSPVDPNAMMMEDMAPEDAMAESANPKKKVAKRYATIALQKHYGPGPHSDGTPQTVHGGGGGGGAAPAGRSGLSRTKADREARSAQFQADSKRRTQWAQEESQASAREKMLDADPKRSPKNRSHFRQEDYKRRTYQRFDEDAAAYQARQEWYESQGLRNTAAMGRLKKSVPDLNATLNTITKGLIDSGVFVPTTTGDDLRAILPPQTLTELSNIPMSAMSAGYPGGTHMADDLETLVENLPDEVLEYIADLESQIDVQESAMDPVAKALSTLDPGVADIFKAQATRLEKAESALALEQIAKADATWISKAATYDSVVDDPQAFGQVLRQVADHDPKLADAIEGVLRAANARVAKGALFAEMGHGSGLAPDLDSKVAVLAKSYRDADPTISAETARAKVWEDNPDLYDNYREEHRQRARSV